VFSWFSSDYVVLVLFAFCCVRFTFFATTPVGWLERTSLKSHILFRVGHKTLTQSVNQQATADTGQMVVCVMYLITLPTRSLMKYNEHVCLSVGYGDGAGNTIEENSSVFSLIRML